MPRKTRVLAVDPGFDRLGVAVMEHRDDKEQVLYSTCITTQPKDSRDVRLLAIGEEVRKIINKWKPNALAIETLFFNQNTTSAIGVAEARGVVIYEAGRGGLEVFEYGPQTIKVAVTGYGRANKLQVENMVQKLVILPKKKGKRLDDELDAIALGITHLASQKGI